MDLQAWFGKTILIRLSDEGDGFVSTVRYGCVYRHSDAWTMEIPCEAGLELPPDEARFKDR